MPILVHGFQWDWPRGSWRMEYPKREGPPGWVGPGGITMKATCLTGACSIAVTDSDAIFVVKKADSSTRHLASLCLCLTSEDHHRGSCCTTSLSQLSSQVPHSSHYHLGLALDASNYVHWHIYLGLLILIICITYAPPPSTRGGVNLEPLL